MPVTSVIRASADDSAPRGDSLQEPLTVNPFQGSMADAGAPQAGEYENGYQYAQSQGHMTLAGMQPDDLARWRPRPLAWRQGFADASATFGLDVASPLGLSTEKTAMTQFWATEYLEKTASAVRSYVPAAGSLLFSGIPGALGSVGGVALARQYGTDLGNRAGLDPAEVERLREAPDVGTGLAGLGGSLAGLIGGAGLGGALGGLVGGGTSALLHGGSASEDILPGAVPGAAYGMVGGAGLGAATGGLLAARAAGRRAADDELKLIQASR